MKVMVIRVTKVDDTFIAALGRAECNYLTATASDAAQAILCLGRAMQKLGEAINGKTDLMTLFGNDV
jgi:hypothetical protein